MPNNCQHSTCTDEAVQLISSCKRNSSNHTYIYYTILYIYINYTDRQRSSTYTKKKKKKNTYSGQGNLELILNSSQLLNLTIIQSGCKTRFINVEREIRLNKFT